MAKMSTNRKALAFTLIGTLVFLFLIYSLWGSLGHWLSAQVASQGSGGATVPTWPSVVQSILYGLAVTSTISLLVVTLVGFKMSNADMNKWAMKAHFIAGFTLIALTVPPAPSTWFWVAIVGFVLTELGTGMAAM